jgi:biopolymer transport protein ExbB
MIPMGICSVILLTLAIERAISLTKSRVGSKSLLARVTRALPSRLHATRDQVSAAVAECNDDGSLVSKVLKTGLEKIHRDEAHAQAILEEAAGKEMHILKRKLRPFNVIASLAPLLGLLGTISGMITCFEKATEADSGSRVSTLTRGIYEALVATATGLSIAILGLIIYHYFLGKVERVVDLVDEAASEFLDHYYGAPAAPRPRITSAPAPSGIIPAEAKALEAGT